MRAASVLNSSSGWSCPSAAPRTSTTRTSYTRAAPAGATRVVGRLAVDDLGTIDERATVYVCGSARFADGASTVLLEAGVPAERIRVERFGPTG